MSINMNKAYILKQLQTDWPDLLGIYAFGSRTTRQAHADSDLDLAILLAGYADPLRLWESAQALASTLDYDVDLLDMRAASSVMQHQILTTGECWWRKDPQAGLFEAAALTEKLHFDQARTALLNDITHTGRVYGR